MHGDAFGVLSEHVSVEQLESYGLHCGALSVPLLYISLCPSCVSPCTSPYTPLTFLIFWPRCLCEIQCCIKHTYLLKFWARAMPLALQVCFGLLDFMPGFESGAIPVHTTATRHKACYCARLSADCCRCSVYDAYIPGGTAVACHQPAPQFARVDQSYFPGISCPPLPPAIPLPG